MNRLWTALLYAIFLLLCSCGEDSLIESDDVHQLSQYVYVVPEKFTGSITNYYAPIEDLYVNQWQTVRFCSGYSIGKEISTSDSMGQYFESIQWNIGSDEFTLSKFRYTFEKAGAFQGSLKTTDLFGDTLHTVFNIYVNAPDAITLDFPYDGYNQADPQNENGLSLKWSITGIDPWEEAYCKIYLSYSADSVWDEPLGSVPCDNDIQILGPLTYDSLETNGKINLRDSSVTLYWAVKMTVENPDGKTRIYPSDIFHFSTKILDKDSSILKIPLYLINYLDTAKLNTVITLLNVDGDTLKVLHGTQKDSVLSTKVKAQTDLKVIVEEKNRLEYQGTSLSIDIAPNTVTWLDTLYLRDNMAPQLSPVSRQFAYDDAIQFYVQDNGSGLNLSKLQVIVGIDTLLYTFSNNSILSFYPHCGFLCNIEIIGEDYAHNPLPPFYWTLRNNVGYVAITGPYLKDGY